MIKINSQNINRFFSDFVLRISRWVSGNKLRLVAFLLLALLTVLASYLPYFNLVFTKSLTLFLVLTILILIFRVGWRKIIYLSLILFVFSYALWLMGLSSDSEFVGNFIFGFIVFAATKYFVAI